MTKQIVYLYDLSNFRHLRLENNLIVGETVYNAQMKSRAIRKYGKAPCRLLTFYPHWFEMSDAERSLTTLGFRRKNKIEWEKAALKKYQDMLSKIPLFHREITKQVVEKKAPMLAQEK